MGWPQLVPINIQMVRNSLLLILHIPNAEIYVSLLMPPLEKHQVICCVEEKYKHILIWSSSIQKEEFMISSLPRSNTMTLKLKVESFMLETESCHGINKIILISLWKPGILTQVSGIRYQEILFCLGRPDHLGPSS